MNRKQPFKKLILITSLLLFAASGFAQSRHIPDLVKKVVFTRDGGKCQCCGSTVSLEYDHIMPYSCGGSSDASNIQLLCKKCNRSKSNSCYCKIHNRKMGYNCCDDETPKSKPKKSRRSSSSTSTSTKTATSSQCTGTTKKGTRCRNMTTNASGRCYLHE